MLMGMALVKNTGGDDPRETLRIKIAEAAKANDRIERHKEAIRRARDKVADIERRLAVAGEQLEAGREKLAEDFVQAATTGAATKRNGALRDLLLTVADCTDELTAAKAAAEHLEVDGQDLAQPKLQLDDAI